MRNRILKGQLRRENCDEKDIFELLSLLKQPEHWEQKEDFIPVIEEEEQRVIVKKAKKRSTSSI